MPEACYALLAATTFRNKPQMLEAPAINGTIQAVNELYHSSQLGRNGRRVIGYALQHYNDVIRKLYCAHA